MWALLPARSLGTPHRTQLAPRPVWASMPPGAEKAGDCGRREAWSPCFQPDPETAPQLLAGLRRCPSQRGLSSLVREVVTDALAAKGGGELRAVTRRRRTKFRPCSRSLGPLWARGCSWGRGRDNVPSAVTPRAGTPLGLRARSRDLPIIPHSCCRLLAGFNAVSLANPRLLCALATPVPTLCTVQQKRKLRPGEGLSQTEY